MWDSREIFLSFQKPRFPHLITEQQAEGLFHDLDFRKDGSIQITKGQGVYGGKGEICFRFRFDARYGDAASGALFSQIINLARWAGQESILIVRDANGYDLLPTSVGQEPVRVGEFLYVQRSQPWTDVPALIWREVTEHKRDVGDHTLIDGKIFTLTPD